MKQKFLLLMLQAFVVLGLNAEVLAGSCGTNLTYNLDTSTGVLKIEGSGKMRDYDLLDYAPWYPYSTKIKTLELSESMESIGNNAFSYCSGLTSVTIPNSVTSIGNNAFYGCGGLISINVDASNEYYTSEDNVLFDKAKTALLFCVRTKKGAYTIPNSVTSIGNDAFYGCTGLTSVSIPNSVTSIGNSAFSYCSGLTSVTIPNSVTSIGEKAFYNCSGLTSATISNSVTSIGEKAFYNCSGLTSVTIPNSVTSIGNYAFYGCKGLTSVAIGNSVTSIGNSAFSDCTGLTSVSIPNSVTSIGNSAFNGCSGLTSVTIPNSVTSIGSWAFHSCDRLTSVTIPNSVTSIGNDAFYGCGGLISINVDASNEYYTSEDNVLFDKAKTALLFCVRTKKGAYTIPNSVTSIGSSAFRDCTSLTSVSIPNSVTSIGNSAFNGCTGLTSVSIPNSVTSIESRAFSSCDRLTSVTISNSVTSIESWAFSSCDRLTSVTIPNSVTSIGDAAFSFCSGLTSVSIPNSVTSIGNDAFSYCSKVNTVNWNANINGSGVFGSSIKEIIIGDDVTMVYPFNTSCKPNKVILGKSVQYVRQNAFQNFKGDFYVYCEEAPYLYPDVFKNATLSSSTLYVPASKASYYKTTAPWNEFGKILNLEGNEPDITQKQCAKPSIAYEDGKLYFATATPGATIYSNVASSDIKSATGTEVTLSGTYTITAVAKRSEYLDSDPATATLHWIEASIDNGDGPVQIVASKRGILISTNDGFVTITGLEKNEVVEAYTTDGKYITTTRAAGNAATITANVGDVVILKIAGENLKVNVR